MHDNHLTLHINTMLSISSDTFQNKQSTLPPQAALTVLPHSPSLPTHLALHINAMLSSL